MTPVPDWLDAVVLALGVYRLTRLLGWDEFPPVAKLRDRLLDKRITRNVTGSTLPEFTFGRPVLAAGVQCPYCLGFWVGLAAYALWLVVPTATLYVLVPFALNAVVGIVARNLD